MVWWHPGRDFVVAPFIGRKIGEDQKKKSLRCNTCWLSVQKYVMTRRKRSLTTNQWVFGLKRKQKKKQNGDTRGGPPTPPLLRCHYS